MSAILYGFISTILISLFAFAGLVTLSFKHNQLQKALLFLISLAAGALLGDVFIHLLPEAIESMGFGLNTSFFILAGIIVFFIIEKIVQWHHSHHLDGEVQHSFTSMNLIGDGMHNFIDGMLIMSSYLVSIPLGIATTIAVIFHEIPQEIGDFAVLIYGGFSTKKALTYNFLSGLVAVLGAGVALLISNSIENFEPLMLLFTAGAFVYIAGADLIPELHKETNWKKSVIQLLGLLSGILIMVLLRVVG